MLTQRNMIRMIIGFSLTDTGVHMVMVSIGYVTGGTAPIINDAVPMAEAASRVVDPVPSALVLEGPSSSGPRGARCESKLAPRRSGRVAALTCSQANMLRMGSGAGAGGTSAEPRASLLLCTCMCACACVCVRV